MTKGKMHWGRLAAASVAALLLLFVAAWFAGDILTRPEQHAIGAAPPDLQAVTVHIAVPGRDEVVGWFAAGKPANGAVLLLHGVRGDRRQMLERARFLHREGYSVLLIDLPGHGESKAARISLGHEEAYAVEAAMAYLGRRAPGERIGVVGVSLGGASTLLSHPAVMPAALVLESVYPTITEAVQDRLRLHLGGAGTALAPLLLWQLPMRLKIGADDLRPIDQLQRWRLPLLIAAGAADLHTTAGETQRMFAQASEPKQLWMIKDAQHVDLCDYAGDEYRSRLLEFLAHHLRSD
jgi:alpha-beta hydrolase superfamily lysophospholipase